MFVQSVVRITQSRYSNSSHSSQNAIDFATRDDTRVYAPYDCTVKCIESISKISDSGNHAIFIESLDKVEGPSKTEKQWMILLHTDSFLSNVKNSLNTGAVIRQGEYFYDEGTFGNGTLGGVPKHIHLQCGWGSVPLTSWGSKGDNIEDCLYIPKGISIINNTGSAGGPAINFRYSSEGPVFDPTDPANPPPTDPQVPSTELDNANARLNRAKEALNKAQSTLQTVNSKLASAKAEAEKQRSLLKKAKEKLLALEVKIDVFMDDTYRTLSLIDTKIIFEMERLFWKLDSEIGVIYNNGISRLTKIFSAMEEGYVKQQENNLANLEALEAKSNNKISVVRNEIGLIFSNLLSGLSADINGLKGIFQNTITQLSNRLSFTRSAINGKLTKFETTIIELFELHRNNSLTADEYNSKSLSAEAYSNNNIPCIVYDLLAKNKL